MIAQLAEALTRELPVAERTAGLVPGETGMMTEARMPGQEGPETLNALVDPLRAAMAAFGEARALASMDDDGVLTLRSDALNVTARWVDGPMGCTSGLPEIALTLTQHDHLRSDHPRVADALLVEMLRRAVPVSGATRVRWTDGVTLLDADRFANAAAPRPIAGKPATGVVTAPPAANLAAPAVRPLRVRPASNLRLHPYVTAIDRASFRPYAKDKTLISGWTVMARCITPPAKAKTTPFAKAQTRHRRAAPVAHVPAESLEDVFRKEVALPPDMVAEDGRHASTERRLATWTVTASIAVFAPPVGAAMATYNLIRGENFRLTAQALTLTGAYMGLGLTRAMADTLALLTLPL